MKTFGWTTTTLFLTLVILLLLTTCVMAEPEKGKVNRHAKQQDKRLYKHKKWYDNDDDDDKKPKKQHIKGERTKKVPPEDKIPHKKAIQMDDKITEYVGPLDETTTQVEISNTSSQPPTTRHVQQPTTTTTTTNNNETIIVREQISEEPSNAASAASSLAVVELPPFQLAFDSSSSTTTPTMNSQDDMRLLQVTMSHVSRTLNMTYELLFDHVEMYHLVVNSHNDDNASVAKVSFGGWAYFFQSSQHTTTNNNELDREQLKKTILLSFLDGSQTTSFIEDLHKSGFEEVTNVALYTLDGRRVVVRNGDLRVLDIGKEPPSEDDVMKEEGSTATRDRNVVGLALMIGVPSFVVVTICLSYCWFEYMKQSVIPDDDVWKSSNNYLVEL